MLTAYDATMAACWIKRHRRLLVGDSLGMVILGGDDTLEVTMDDMVRHTRAVRRARSALVSPTCFMSYQPARRRSATPAVDGRRRRGSGEARRRRAMLETVERLVSVGIRSWGILD
jgi:3-methyl-2-oxobutanoate hydroxymethyltransferase